MFSRRIAPYNIHIHRHHKRTDVNMLALFNWMRFLEKGFSQKYSQNKEEQSKCAINDPLGQTHIHASSDHYSRLDFVLFRENFSK